MMEEKKYYIGPAGWSYPDWKGVVYPKGMKTHPLNFLENYFNMIEINTSFYHLPRLSMVENWCKILTEEDFLFVLKLGQKFTHERKDISKEDIEGYKNIFNEVKCHERLGGVLVQFPWSFINIGENFDHLKKIIEWFSDFPLIVEVRHITWHKRGFFEFLNKNNVAFCNIDQPETRNSIKLTETIRTIHEKGLRIFVVGNNHFKGQAVVNLLQIQSGLSDTKLALPEPLAQHYV